MSQPISVFIEDAQKPTVIRNVDVAERLRIKDGDRLDRKKSAKLLAALRKEIRTQRRRSSRRARPRLKP